MKKNAATYFTSAYETSTQAKFLSLSDCIQNSETYQALRYGTTEGFGFTQVDKRGALIVSVLSMIVLFGAAFIA